MLPNELVDVPIDHPPRRYRKAPVALRRSQQWEHV